MIYYLVIGFVCIVHVLKKSGLWRLQWENWSKHFYLTEQLSTMKMPEIFGSTLILRQPASSDQYTFMIKSETEKTEYMRWMSCVLFVLNLTGGHLQIFRWPFTTRFIQLSASNNWIQWWLFRNEYNYMTVIQTFPLGQVVPLAWVPEIRFAFWPGWVSQIVIGTSCSQQIGKCFPFCGKMTMNGLEQLG